MHSYFYALQKGEVLKSDTTADEEYARIEEDKKRDNIPEDQSQTLKRTSSMAGNLSSVGTKTEEKVPEKG